MLWWTDDLKTGIEHIDEEHKSIFDKVGMILDLSNTTDLEAIENVWSFLSNYVIQHFSHEEAVMFKNHYKNFTHHRDEHSYFIKQLYRLYNKASEHGLNDHIIDGLKLLVLEWLINHITQEDRALAQFLQKNDCH
ncbi:bacteriohemerythrin [Cellulosilyticum sp. I15G10I2]|uniref:bacteriohemerythrin n=1 Tax=Cellulosilyticum sp. I15G10I2 TaxID=1892843 RepID=UPI00085C954C|nr:bacteriohemerythrin [Cellulosilyticum sp. I15G10I2]